MGNVFYFDWEVRFLTWLQTLGEGTFLQGLLQFVNQFFSFLGEEMICIVLISLIYFGIDKEKGKRIGFMVIMTFAANDMIKNVFKRLRPYQSVEEIKLLRDVGGYSFPSGHSANAAILYPSIAYEFREKKWKWLTGIAIIVPLFVALSRNVLGAHWPTDVLAGLAQGLVFLIVMEVLWRKVKNQKVFLLCCNLLVLLGVFFCRTEDYFTAAGMMIGFSLGVCFDEQFVKFENTKSTFGRIVRTIGGIVTFLIANGLLKIIFAIIPQDGAFIISLIRILRYAVAVFVLVGVYPLSFRLFKREK